MKEGHQLQEAHKLFIERLGLFVKKRKRRQLRQRHLHKDYIRKLQLVLKPLYNDKLSPKHLNDTKDRLKDFSECNQRHLHKDYIRKLQLVLKPLYNDKLSPKHLNDAKDRLKDFPECNQEDFGQFGSSSPLDELEDLVGPLSKFNSLSIQPGLGLGGQTPDINSVTSVSLQQQPNSILQQSSQQALPTSVPKDAGNI